MLLQFLRLIRAPRQGGLGHHLLPAIAGQIGKPGLDIFENPVGGQAEGHVLRAGLGGAGIHGQDQAFQLQRIAQDRVVISISR